jgi:hypothetical protein
MCKQAHGQKLMQEEDSDGYLEGNDGAVELRPPPFDSDVSSEQVRGFLSFISNTHSDCTFSIFFMFSTSKTSAIAMKMTNKTAMTLILRRKAPGQDFPAQMLSLG